MLFEIWRDLSLSGLLAFLDDKDWYSNVSGWHRSRTFHEMLPPVKDVLSKGALRYVRNLVTLILSLLQQNIQHIINVPPGIGYLLEQATLGLQWRGKRNTHIRKMWPIHSGLFCWSPRKLLYGNYFQSDSIYRLEDWIQKFAFLKLPWGHRFAWRFSPGAGMIRM